MIGFTFFLRFDTPERHPDLEEENLYSENQVCVDQIHDKHVYF